ncbi:energy-coupling factor ABC transporter ATP-binding protein [Brevibacillus humidisoli]|uniref:energy-coupling factor ABC transporter ATP-binding protein n=1 Tax=Brevibacillus humidisoli TaxID=2895522 RepID=UPI001E54C878|nr:ABC transporter ATP-binding protein [Brevibacillus humidisoli]UFJ39525.1 energy-coupling factor ABC transporter ATP-binding protein [Brevibacillus humidisoli]
MTSIPSAIHFDSVSYSYASEQPVLNNVTVTIGQGELVAVIGGNGSGKTTFAKLCNGLYKPTVGRVLVNGRDTRESTVAELAVEVAYCYQNPDHQIFQSSVWEEVAFGPKNLGLDERDVEVRVGEALRSVGLEHLRDEEPYFAGKGTRQMIAVASILAMQPQSIILDEPTTGLDYRGVSDMMALIKQLHQQGHTILVITHDMQLVAEYAERVLVMHQGQILCDDKPEFVFAQPELLSQAQVEPPAACRFGLAAGIVDPLPLTLSRLQARLAKERKEAN